MANNITIRVGSQDNASPTVDQLKKQLQDLGKTAVSAKVDVNDKDANVKAAQINARIAALDKRVANPKVKWDDAAVAKFEAERLALEAQLSHLGDKSGPTAGQKFVKGFAGYAIPGLKTAIVAGGGIGLAALPALAGIQGIAIGAKLVTGIATSILAQNKQVQAAFKGIGNDIMGSLQGAVKPLVPVVIAAGKQVADFVKKIQPELQGLFKSLAPVITPVLKAVEGIGQQLIGVMKAVVPAIGPFITGLLKLVKDLLPGFRELIKSTVPFVGEFGKILGNLGSSLGAVFKSFATAIKPSFAVLGDLLNAVSGLLPVIADLAGVFAKALAPVLKDLGGIFESLEPAISTVGKVLASFAGAVLTSLSGALKAIGELLKGIAPSFGILAQALKQVFTLMENSGVFGVLEDALENLAKPLANLINALVKSLAPFIPQIIQLITQLSAVLVTLLSDGLVAVLNVVTKLITKFPLLVPVTLAIVAGIKAWAAAQTILNVVLDANPIGLIITAVGALVVAVVELVKHWSDVKDAFITAWDAILDFIKKWWPELIGVVTGGLGLVIAVIVKYHTQIFGAIEKAWNAVFGFIKGIWNDLLSFARQWWPLLLGPTGVILKFHTQIENAIRNAWDKVLSFLKGVWNDIKSAASNAWNDVKSTVVNALTALGNAIRNVWGDIVSFMKGMPNKLVNALFGLGHSLAAFVRAAFEEMWTAMKNVGSDILHWLGDFVHSVVGIVKGILGIASPSAVFHDIGLNMMKGMENGIKAGAHKAAEAAEAAARKKVASTGSPGPGGGAPAANAKLAQRLYPAWGKGAQWAAWNNVAMHESGWNNLATNGGRPYDPYNVAYGIPQALPAIKMGAAANPPSSNPTAQINWMHGYIKDRYTDPIGAWKWWQNHHWYGSGGATPSGLIGVGEFGPELIRVPGGSTVIPHGQSEQMMSGSCSGHDIHLTIDTAGSPIDEALLQLIRKAIRVRGGNVQKVLSH